MTDQPRNHTPSDSDKSLAPEEAVVDQGASPSADATRSQVEKLEAELAEAQDRVLRCQAELENFRRRVQREREEERRYTNQELLTDLLPVLDNIERAILAATQSSEGGGLLEGFRMVHEQLLGVLDKFGCPQIQAEGVAFDPQEHEAIAQEHSNEHDQGVVTRVNLKGYKLHDRVIRPAQVIVSKGPPETKG